MRRLRLGRGRRERLLHRSRVWQMLVWSGFGAVVGGGLPYRRRDGSCVVAERVLAAFLVDDPVGEHEFGLGDEDDGEVEAVGDEGFGGAADGAAAGEGSGDLGDFVDCGVEFGVRFAVGVQFAGEGFGGGHVEVGEDVTAEDFARQSEAEEIGGEVGAVVAAEGVRAAVGGVVEPVEDGFVLGG